MKLKYEALCLGYWRFDEIIVIEVTQDHHRLAIVVGAIGLFQRLVFYSLATPPFFSRFRRMFCF
jgi:hypothetical protein